MVVDMFTEVEVAIDAIVVGVSAVEPKLLVMIVDEAGKELFATGAIRLTGGTSSKTDDDEFVGR